MRPRRMAVAACAAALSCLAALIAGSASVLLPAVAGARSARVAILPPDNPPYSLGIGRNLPGSCAGVRDLAAACMRESLGMLNAGRRSEALGPLVLPANWKSLSVAQQLFVLSELERSARGLPPDQGLSVSLNGAAVRGADAGRDPSGGAGGIESLWAGGEPNTIVVVADWIYEDGLFAGGFAENLNCSVSAPAGCWQHRDILLHDGTSGSCGSRCAVGAGYSPDGYAAAAAAGTGADSYAEVFAPGPGGAQSFTWAAELRQLPACERTADTCAWAGRPIATAGGISTVATARHAPTNTRPWFSTAVTSKLGGHGRIGLSIHAGIRLRRVTVLAHRGRAKVGLRVRRLSRHAYRATGRLGAGRWTLRIRYWTLRRGWRRPTAALPVTVP